MTGRKITLILFAALGINLQATKQIHCFRSQDVTLLPGIFKDAENTDMKYIMSLNPDKLLAPFFREAGLTAKESSYTNWENTGLDGHICGHYLSALSLLYASTNDPAVLNRLNYMLDELQKCQQNNRNGYIGGVPDSKTLWKDIAQGKFSAGSFDINHKWVPLYNIHKTYAGLRDAYVYAGSKKAKKMLINFCDWMITETSKLDEKQIQNLLRSEHGGLNEVFADVAHFTGKKKYLTLAFKFSHKAILEPLQNRVDNLNGLHANTQIPKVTGFEKIARVSGNSNYHDAAHFFWETVVNHRTCAIGGNSVKEHFHPADNFESMIKSEQGPETCNTYNMLRLTKLLYESEGKNNYIEFYERAMYNHILSSQQPQQGGFVYFTPMRPGHYRVYSQPQTSMWCCVGSGMENHAKYNELIYAYSKNELFVNLFIPSRLKWTEKRITITQNTDFPESDVTTLTIGAKKTTRFSLNVRYPMWVNPGALKIEINGQAIDINQSPGNYATITRNWKEGDKVAIRLPMKIRSEKMPDGSNYTAFLYGPVVLAAKTDTTALNGLFADDSRGGHIASGPLYPLQDMPVLVTKEENPAEKIYPVVGKSLTFSASDLIYQDKFKQLQLIPFYKLHNSRYIIYWQIETPDKIQQIVQQLANEENQKQKLLEMTLDMVSCGEQQPESDHFVESFNSNTGVYKNKHWRDATGWFSYKLSDKDVQAARLLVTYSGNDKNRAFSIFINNKLLKHVTLNGTKGDSFFTEEYTIPEEIHPKTKTIEIKFVADNKSVAGGIYEIRLIKKQ